VDITWLGHSCFRIKSSAAVIITDPLPSGLGYEPGKQAADIVTISHQHPSHSCLDMVSGQPKIIKSPGEYEISDILIIGITTYHDAVKGQSRGKNTVYLMDIDGVTLCHAGDLGHVPNDEQLEEMGNIDVLMLPVGGASTINASMAAEVVRKVEPKIVIPMHYKTEKATRELDDAGPFLKELGRGEAEERQKASVTKSNLPAGMQVYLFTPQG
jgi:L-ascorbate metabolism protein UlaG (beta-lactamase superfamily)